MSEIRDFLEIFSTLLREIVSALDEGDNARLKRAALDMAADRAEKESARKILEG